VQLPFLKHLAFYDPLPLLLAVLALAIYLPGITWGIPYPTGLDRTHAWGNDDQVPLAPLAEMHNTFFVAKPDRNIAYPWFHFFLVASVYSPYFLYLLLTGGLKDISPIFPFGLTDPNATFFHLSLIGRSVSLLLAIATIVGSYYTGKYLWNRRVGFLSGILTMLMFPMAYYARVGNLDIPVLGWTSLGIAVFVLILRKGLTIRLGAWFAVFVALAVATKDQAAGSFFLLPLVLLSLHLFSKEQHSLWGWTSRWTAPFVTAVSFLFVYIFASGIPIDPTRYLQHVSKILAVGGQGVLYLRHPGTWEGYVSHAQDLLGYLVDVMSWPVLLAAGIGVIFAIKQDRRSLWLLLSSLGFLLILAPVRMSRMHYLLPVALPLIPFAAFAFFYALRCQNWIRLTSVIVVLLAISHLFLQTIDLTHAMIFDSRYTASEWFKEQSKPGDQVVYFAARHFNPYFEDYITSIPVWHRAEALPTIQRIRPEFIVITPDDINEERHRVEWRDGPHSIVSDHIPTPVYSQLVNGTLGYRLVAKFQTPRLIPWINRPFLSYPTVNLPIHIYIREDRASELPRVLPWSTAPHNPTFIRVRELTVDVLKNP